MVDINKSGSDLTVNLSLRSSQTDDEVECLLSEKLMDGFALMEKACPSCLTPLVKKPTIGGESDPANHNIQQDLETPLVVPIESLEKNFGPFTGVPFCVTCKAHVVTDQLEHERLETCKKIGYTESTQAYLPTEPAVPSTDLLPMKNVDENNHPPVEDGVEMGYMAENECYEQDNTNHCSDPDATTNTTRDSNNENTDTETPHSEEGFHEKDSREVEAETTETCNGLMQNGSEKEMDNDQVMQEYKIRREIATKVLGAKMLQGYALKETQCTKCGMPLMEYEEKLDCVVCPVLKKKAEKKRMELNKQNTHATQTRDMNQEDIESVKMSLVRGEEEKEEAKNALKELMERHRSSAYTDEQWKNLPDNIKKVLPPATAVSPKEEVLSQTNAMTPQPETCESSLVVSEQTDMSQYETAVSLQYDRSTSPKYEISLSSVNGAVQENAFSEASEGSPRNEFIEPSIKYETPVRDPAQQTNEIAIPPEYDMADSAEEMHEIITPPEYDMADSAKEMHEIITPPEYDMADSAKEKHEIATTDSAKEKYEIVTPPEYAMPDSAKETHDIVTPPEYDIDSSPDSALETVSPDSQNPPGFRTVEDSNGFDVVAVSSPNNIEAADARYMELELKESMLLEEARAAKEAEQAAQEELKAIEGDSEAQKQQRLAEIRSEADRAEELRNQQLQLIDQAKRLENMERARLANEVKFNSVAEAMLADLALSQERKRLREEAIRQKEMQALEESRREAEIEAKRAADERRIEEESRLIEALEKEAEMKALAAEEALAKAKEALEQVHSARRDIIQQTIAQAEAEAVAEAEAHFLAEHEDVKEDIVLPTKSDEIRENWETLRFEGRAVMTRRLMSGWKMMSSFCQGAECQGSVLITNGKRQECVVCGGSGDGKDGVYAATCSSAEDDEEDDNEALVVVQEHKERELDEKASDLATADSFETEIMQRKTVQDLHNDFEAKRQMVSEEIGKRMLQGWTLLDMSCPNCVMPLLTDEKGQNEICVLCGVIGVLPSPEHEEEQIEERVTAEPVEQNSKVPVEQRKAKEPLEQRRAQEPFEQRNVEDAERRNADKPIKQRNAEEPVEQRNADEPVEQQNAEEPFASVPVQRNAEEGPVERHAQEEPIEWYAQEVPAEEEPVERRVKEEPVERVERYAEEDSVERVEQYADEEPVEIEQYAEEEPVEIEHYAEEEPVEIEQYAEEEPVEIERYAQEEPVERYAQEEPVERNAEELLERVAEQAAEENGTTSNMLPVPKASYDLLCHTIQCTPEQNGVSFFPIVEVQHVQEEVHRQSNVIYSIGPKQESSSDARMQLDAPAEKSTATEVRQPGNVGEVDRSNQQPYQMEGTHVESRSRHETAGCQPATSMAEKVADCQPAASMAEKVAGCQPAASMAEKVAGCMAEEVAGCQPAASMAEEVAGCQPAASMAEEVAEMLGRQGEQSGIEVVDEQGATELVDEQGATELVVDEQGATELVDEQEGVRSLLARGSSSPLVSGTSSPTFKSNKGSPSPARGGSDPPAKSAVAMVGRQRVGKEPEECKKPKMRKIAHVEVQNQDEDSSIEVATSYQEPSTNETENKSPTYNARGNGTTEEPIVIEESASEMKDTESISKNNSDRPIIVEEDMNVPESSPKNNAEKPIIVEEDMNAPEPSPKNNAEKTIFVEEATNVSESTPENNADKSIVVEDGTQRKVADQPSASRKPKRGGNVTLTIPKGFDISDEAMFRKLIMAAKEAKMKERSSRAEARESKESKDKVEEVRECNDTDVQKKRSTVSSDPPQYRSSYRRPPRLEVETEPTINQMLPSPGEKKASSSGLSSSGSCPGRFARKYFPSPRPYRRAPVTPESLTRPRGYTNSSRAANHKSTVSSMTASISSKESRLPPRACAPKPDMGMNFSKFSPKSPSKRNDVFVIGGPIEDRDDKSVGSLESRAESVASMTFDAILSRIDECKAKLSTPAKNREEIEKQSEMADLIGKLASAAVAVRKLEGI